MALRPRHGGSENGAQKNLVCLGNHCYLDGAVASCICAMVGSAPAKLY